MTLSKYDQEMLELYNKSIGNKEKKDYYGIPCPTNEDIACKLCNLCRDIFFNVSQDSPLREKASELNSKQRFYSNAIFLASPKEVVVFEYGPKIFNQLIALQMAANSEHKNFMDPNTGHNLRIEKVKGTGRKQVEYYIRPRDQKSPLPGSEVLQALSQPNHNLTNVVSNILSGKVKTIYQSKLDLLTEIRILPSWLGPQVMIKFFQRALWHFGVNETDFAAIQAGALNPFAEERTATRPPSTTTEERTAYDCLAPSGWVLPQPTQTGTTAIDESWKKKLSQINQESVEDEEPGCWGDFDQTNEECTTGCDWSKTCEEEWEKKIEKRKAAKRLQRK